MTMTNKTLARLLHQCAQACDGDDKKRLDAGENITVSACGASSRCSDVCEQTAKEQGAEDFGRVCYLLLAYTWNDTLDWADKQLDISPLDPNYEKAAVREVTD